MGAALGGAFDTSKRRGRAEAVVTLGIVYVGLSAGRDERAVEVGLLLPQPLGEWKTFR